MDRAIFLDKDGTLVEDVPYNVDPGLVRLAPNAIKALRLLAGEGFRLVVVTNQSGVARGYFEEARVEAIGDHLRDVLRRAGVQLAGFYYCPHLPDGAVERYRLDCDCRKPAPGLIARACRELSLDAGASWLVGDIATDIAAGQAGGTRTALVNADPAVELAALDQAPDIVAPNLLTAAHTIAHRTRDAAAALQPS